MPAVLQSNSRSARNMASPKPQRTTLSPSSIASRFLGLSLLIAAAGLWLVPGSSLASEMLLIKMGMSVFFVIGGAILVHASTAAPQTQT